MSSRLLPVGKLESAAERDARTLRDAVPCPFCGHDQVRIDTPKAGHVICAGDGCIAEMYGGLKEWNQRSFAAVLVSLAQFNTDQLDQIRAALTKEEPTFWDKV